MRLVSGPRDGRPVEHSRGGQGGAERAQRATPRQSSFVHETPQIFTSIYAASGNPDVEICAEPLVAFTLLTTSALQYAAMRYFKSDNTAAVCPEILAALATANHGVALAYGADRWSESLDAVFGTFFETEVRVFAVA